MRLPVQLRKRKADTHKGDYGHVLVLGASEGLCGSVCLCAEASLRIGAGKVSVAIPASLEPIIQAKLTEAVTIALSQTARKSISCRALGTLRRRIESVEAAAVGMGASSIPETAACIREIVTTVEKPMVVDADGINAFAGKAALLRKRKSSLVLTPHLKEFSRLTGTTVACIKKHRKKLAKEFALQYNLILVLKGHRTIVTDGRLFFENSTGNPGMATAGSGDVLSGIIAGMIAQKVPLYEAACAGVYLHGLAGDIAAREKTEISLIASDIIGKIPEAIKIMRRGTRTGCWRSSTGRANDL